MLSVGKNAYFKNLLINKSFFETTIFHLSRISGLTEQQ